MSDVFALEYFHDGAVTPEFQWGSNLLSALILVSALFLIVYRLRIRVPFAN